LEGAGLLYPEGDIPALAERLSSLLSDPQLRDQLGSAGRKRVKDKYNWEEVARQTLELHHSLQT
jgi:glycosyltransferase involved in cell wall biosynthesis